MSNDKYDYLQVYDLVPFSSCKYRATEGGECESNKEYMMENCATMCNMLPLVSFLCFHCLLESYLLLYLNLFVTYNLFLLVYTPVQWKNCSIEKCP